MTYTIYAEGAPVIIADMDNYMHWEPMAKNTTEKETETYYKYVCDELDGFGLISFMSDKHAVFMETMGGGPIYIYLDEKNKDILIFKSLSQMTFDEALKIFQSETEVVKVPEGLPWNAFIIADSACDLMNFRSVEGDSRQERINYMNSKIVQNNIFELIYEGDANASGVVFSSPNNKYNCSGKYIEVNENQSVFGLHFTPIKN